MKKILLIEDCNYKDFPIGGQLTFAKQLMLNFNNELILIGSTTENLDKIGQWTKKNIDGCEYNFLPIIYRNKNKKKPFIPARISWTLALLKNKKKIRKCNVKYAITQNINSLFPALKFRFKVFHISAGLNNPFNYLRYKGFRIFKPIFQKFWEKQLSKTEYLLAASDIETINKFKKESKYLKNKEIISFPTRYYDKIFYVKNAVALRKKYNFNSDTFIITCSGRINNVKGWDFVLDSFKIFLKKIPNSLLIFIGDGEDKNSLINYAKKLGVFDKIFLTGFVNPEKVSDYLNLSDLTVLGSHKEGWCTSIVEALACGRNVVSTNVSGINEMIKNDINGYVVKKRDPSIFAKKMHDSLNLPQINKISLDSVSAYKVSLLKEEIKKIWKEIR